jgi:hypothetical protein
MQNNCAPGGPSPKAEVKRWTPTVLTGGKK